MSTGGGPDGGGDGPGPPRLEWIERAMRERLPYWVALLHARNRNVPPGRREHLAEEAAAWAHAQSLRPGQQYHGELHYRRWLVLVARHWLDDNLSPTPPPPPGDVPDPRADEPDDPGDTIEGEAVRFCLAGLTPEEARVFRRLQRRVRLRRGGWVRVPGLTLDEMANELWPLPDPRGRTPAGRRAAVYRLRISGDRKMADCLRQRGLDPAGLDPTDLDPAG